MKEKNSISSKFLNSNYKKIKKLDFLLLVFQPLGFLYGLIMKLRAWLYKKDFFPRTNFNVPVISVGNLSMGGTGKTPVVIYISRLLLKYGFKPAVVSRGYRGTANRKSNIVSDGSNIYLDAEMSGDEPRLIAETVPDIVVITGKKRKYPCAVATKQFKCNAIILDDGFQHLSVKRDLNLVLFNASALKKSMRVFPSGFLREPFSALKRADCFIITGCNTTDSQVINTFKTTLTASFPKTPVFLNQYLAQCLVDQDGAIFDCGKLKKPVLAFCGIASPSRFEATLNETSITYLDLLTFKDHEIYTPATIASIEKRAKLLGCEALITTTKDMVKFKKIKIELKLYALKMDVVFDQKFDDYIIQSINHRSCEHNQ